MAATSNVDIDMYIKYLVEYNRVCAFRLMLDQGHVNTADMYTVISYSRADMLYAAIERDFDEYVDFPDLLSHAIRLENEAMVDLLKEHCHVTAAHVRDSRDASTYRIYDKVSRSLGIVPDVAPILEGNVKDLDILEEVHILCSSGNSKAVLQYLEDGAKANFMLGRIYVVLLWMMHGGVSIECGRALIDLFPDTVISSIHRPFVLAVKNGLLDLAELLASHYSILQFDAGFGDAFWVMILAAARYGAVDVIARMISWKLKHDQMPLTVAADLMCLMRPVAVMDLTMPRIVGMLTPDQLESSVHMLHLASCVSGLGLTRDVMHKRLVHHCTL